MNNKEILKILPYSANVSIRKLELIYFNCDIVCDGDKKQIIVMRKSK